MPKRAHALLRLGRVQRQRGDIAAARQTFQALALLDETRVAGLPAGLAGRVAEMRLLADGHDTSAASALARDIAASLARGRWVLSQAQYEHYVELITPLAGPAAAVDPTQLAVTRAVAVLARETGAGLPPVGRRTITSDAGPLLALWRTAHGRSAVWITTAQPLLSRLQVPAGLLVIEGPQESTARESRQQDVVAVRHSGDTGLPWTVRASLRDTGTAGAGGGTRRRLVVIAASLLVASLVTGFWLAGRAAQREMALARAQADFVSTVSHEFRTPLAAMRQLSELLASGRVATDARRQQYYESLASESRRLQRLVENLLDFGRLQAGARAFTMEPVDAASLVERVVGEFRAQPVARSCTIEVEQPAGAVILRADADALALALHNLLDNAAKYSDDDAHIRVSWRQEGDRVALSVQDTGIGIAPEDRTRIFDRFTRGSGDAAQRVRGTGIGLAVVQQVVAGHGGEVGVDSSPGRGSTFTIRLPISTAHHGDAA